MPHVRADISFFIQIESFHNIDLFQRGYYQLRYCLKAGNSSSPVSTFGQSAIAIYPPVIFSRDSGASIIYGDNSSQQSISKGCSSAALIMYQKESNNFNEAFEQQIQVNVGMSQLEDVFSQIELMFCAELWFAEETETDVSNDKLELLTSHQKRVQMSPTRGICDQFNIIFDFLHLCAVEFAIQGYLTNIQPGLYRSGSINNNLQSLAAYENYAKQTWKDMIVSSSPLNDDIHPFAIATHRHLCQALLSSRERMYTFWHDIAIFLEKNFHPSSENANLRGLLDRLTSNFQQLSAESEMANQIAQDVSHLASENQQIFRQLCEFLHGVPRVFRHIQRKSHQVRMKRLAEAFFVQELQIPQVLAVFDPAVIGHEAMATAVRQSAYFRCLPELPVSCRQFDGDASNIPIIFEDVYVPLTDAQRNGIVQSSTSADVVVPEVSARPMRRILDEEVLSKFTPAPPRPETTSLRPSSVMSIDDPAIAELLQSPSSGSGSATSFLNYPRNLILRRRGQQFSLNDATSARRQSRLSLGRYNRSTNALALKEVAGMHRNSVIGGSSATEGDIRLLGYRRIVDDTLECSDVNINSPKSPRNGLPVEEEIENEGSIPKILQNGGIPDSSTGLDCPAVLSRRSTSMVNLSASTSDLNSKILFHQRLRNHNHHSNPPRPISDSHPSPQINNRLLQPKPTPQQLPHSTSTPNLHAALGSNLPGCLGASDTVFIDRCPRCGLPDLLTVCRATRDRENRKPVQKSSLSPTLVTSLSLPSLSSLDPAVAAAMACSSFSEGSGAHLSNGVGGRPTMRRLKQQSRQQRANRVFKRRRRNQQFSSVHLYTEDLVNYGSLSDLISHSCQCNRLSVFRDDSQRFSTSTDSFQVVKPPQPITEFFRAPQRKTFEPLQFPSRTAVERKDLRDSGGSETMIEYLAEMDLETEEEAVKAVDNVDAGPRTIDGVKWAIQNPEKALAFAQNRITQAEIDRWVLMNPGEGLALLNFSRGGNGHQESHWPPSDERRSLSQTLLSSNGVVTAATDADKVTTTTQPHHLGLPDTEQQSRSVSSLLSTAPTEQRLVNTFAPGTMTFVMLKEQLKQHVLVPPTFRGHIYSDFSQLKVPLPYFSNPKPKTMDVHLVICVHGLEGNSTDLRILAMYLQMALPDYPLEFLMSSSNHDDTFGSLEQLRDNLVKEILEHIDGMPAKPTHISFIGHSLGCVLIRAALSSERLAPLYPRLYTFLSCCGPHLGTLYGTSGLVAVGMWALQKLKKSRSLLQLRLRDHPDPRETFLYHLSGAEGLEHFRHILLVASPQDHYVPHHSSRIELCRAALNDPSEMGIVYMEMVANLLQRLIKGGRTTVVRYDVNHAVQSSPNHFIGRAAHVAVLDSDVFIEKFFSVSAARFFRTDSVTSPFATTNSDSVETTSVEVSLHAG